ncbi:beta-N-acetylhexosaminidase [Allonocardiopsis opalescens]|uniref:beta-N-acetylhexosaminidase n=1 Tax=Allonocardiopsis opalescens TaxID=1144618 RepID=A0A2T0PVA4_9ACTN|nr:beta-N-acetylhexosaminidase [Allonocardiopsis opalescens]PRX95464.1 hexosaminidase [Allonocardiopsis opalescens]
MVIPLPMSSAPEQGRFTLTADTRLAADPGLAAAARRLRAAVGPATGFALADGEPGPGAVVLALAAPAAAEELGPEGYELDAGPDGVQVRAGGPAGAFYAVQSLLQLLPPGIHRRAPVEGADWSVPAVRMRDRPRFGWRGCMIDVARHFLPKAALLRVIDLLALHKINVLHLHLTDDQGWRIEIRRYPRLTEVGGWRRETQIGGRRDSPGDGRPHGGFYTQDDIREIVAYAAERFITVVPEVDVPGHSQAAIAAYPELGNPAADGRSEPLETGTRWGIIETVLNVEDATVDFYRNVFDEVMELFPGSYLCVGGDECPKGEWRASPRAQQRMRELGLADEDELQSWFIRRFDGYFAERGRRLIGWDEILEGGLAPGATVLSWRGTEGGITAARAGHDVVMCPVDTAYLNYRQADSEAEPVPVGTVVDLATVHGYEPVPAELTEAEAAHVLGTQVNLWTEHIDSPRGVDYMLFPRLAAFADIAWAQRTADGVRDHAGFLDRLGPHLERLDALGVEYRPLDGPRPWQRRPGVPGWPPH